MLPKIMDFKSKPPAVKASLVYLLANLILKGLSVISGPIFTRIMSTDEYGMVSTFMSWQSVLSVLVTLNLSSGVFNNGMLDFKDDRKIFVSSLAAVSTVTAAVFLILYLIFQRLLDPLFEMPSALIICMAMYFMFVPAYSYWSGWQRYEFKYKKLFFAIVGTAVTSTALGILIVCLSPEGNRGEVKVLTTESVSIVVGIAFYIYLLVKAKFTIKWSYIKYALVFNLPLIPHYLSSYVLASSDRIMITKMVNQSATAIYSVAYTVGMILNIVWQSIDASLSPWVYQKLADKQEKDLRKTTFRILLLFAVMCMLCTLFAPEIMAVLAPAEYYEGVFIIPTIAAGGFFIAAYSLYMRIELFYKETVFASVATMIAAGLNVVLNLIFIHLFGYFAAGYTTMGCYFILYILHYINIKKRGYHSAVRSKAVFILSIFVIICSLLITFLYSYTVVRYVLIAAILIGGIMKRRDIKQLIRL